MPRRRSAGTVLKTQQPVLELEHQIQETERRLGEMKARLAQLHEAHREQIRRSLISKDPEERDMAEAIAGWWSVSLPKADA